ncbi:diguanylate cyclase/phosphodiesterase (GGDEF & EAL domains) with PAS/PAC sensor(s) [hydrothermal vent metagenome]|uniref:Diguanylate cyclase/phosphodiesterase (GGDEF & EAL domains) with PAS/PAC sensor(S) n=1 Tax=hydrothermal vent metagenome TaxID=652676 RepID=A0A3B0X4A2_9ZZZZ
MNRKSHTLQKTLALTILLIGAIGIALVIATDYTYRQLAFEQQKESTSQLIELKSTDLIEKLSEHQKNLGFRLQGESKFSNAVESSNIKDITYWLDQEFSRFYVTIGLIELEKVIVYDKNFQLVSYSERGLSIINKSRLPCTQLIEHVKSLPSLQRTKPSTSLCEYNDRPLLSTVVSIGSLKPKGYIQVITNPAHILTKIETELGIPLKIFNQKNNLLHQSNNWPVNNTSQNHLISTYTVSESGTSYMHISGASDISAFIEHLNSTRFKIILGASALTLITLLFALMILHRGLLPLNNLKRAVNSSARGEFTSVDESGYSEITTPIIAFNAMVGKIQALINDLQDEVLQHKKTEEKFKKAKDVAEKHAQQEKKQSNFLHLTMQSIVDGVITTDINGYIKTINPTAEQLTGWSESEADGKPLVQVMHALNEETLKRIYDPTENVEHKTVLDKPINAVLIQRNSNIETPVEYIVAPMRDHEDEIAGIVIIIHDESIQRSLNRQLTFQATHDALTGLINRYEFERRLKNVISMQKSEGSVNTLCYIDLDQFKLVNDTCGHTAGDELLKQITLLLQNGLEGTGTLARLGGDEFGLLLENCNITDAQEIAEKLLQVIQKFHFSWSESTFTIGASIGISSIINSTSSCEEVIGNADSACYLAKESGRNRIQVFTAEDDKLLTQQREMHWVSRINHALEENRFQLYFQVIMPLNSHEQSFILHGEILLRMINKEGDIVSPSNFLPAAERYNMITLIDEWVVEKSIQWLASQKDKVLISVNLSGMSLSNRDFLNFVVSKIKQHKVNPELLCFEITETAAISHLSTAIHFMNVLKKLGCSFALDDFGSGLSSFSYLTSLPVDYLKIDGAFVMDIDKDPMHYAMVKSINEVGQVMGIKTIAEYAASEGIIKSLREIGVDNAQGYAVARPVPLASISPETSKPVLTTVKNKN